MVLEWLKQHFIIHEMPPLFSEILWHKPQHILFSSRKTKTVGMSLNVLLSLSLDFFAILEEVFLVLHKIENLCKIGISPSPFLGVLVNHTQATCLVCSSHPGRLCTAETVVVHGWVISRAFRMDSWKKASFLHVLSLSGSTFQLSHEEHRAHYGGLSAGEIQTARGERESSLVPLMSLPKFHLWLNQKLSDSFTLSQSSSQSK